MPGKAGQIVLRPVVAEVVEQQERIEIARLSKSESPAQMNAGALEGRSGLRNFLDGADGHGSLLACGMLPALQLTPQGGNSLSSTSPRDRLGDDRLRLFLYVAQVVAPGEALGVQLVDLLGSGGARGEPAVLQNDFQPADRGAVPRGVRPQARDL